MTSNQKHNNNSASAAKARKYQDREDDTMRTMRCVCDLCECGAHSCSTFEVPTTNDTSKQSCRPGWSDHNNRCCSVNNYRDSMRDQVDGGSGSEHECQCLTSERYLTKQAESQRDKQTMRKSSFVVDKDERVDDDHELLHVLVTRPEIASKPRDNIVFEGDMDLQTTFDTTYEALAKQRLDNWKKYQEGKLTTTGGEIIAGDGDSKSRSKSCKKTNKRSAQQEDTFDQKQLGVSTDELRKQPQMRSQRRRRRRQDHDEMGEASSSNADERYLSSPSEGRKTKTKAVIKAATECNHINSNEGQANSNHGCSERQQQQQQPLPAKALDREPKRSPTANKQANNADNETIMTPNLYLAESKNIDPDLSPILVYNANMNRLDKVCPRRRSKYRPSTSLRPGARGLFGDQEVDMSQQQQQQQQQQAAQTVGSHHQVASPPANDSLPVRSPQKQRAAYSSAWSPELNSRTEQALNARNLANSNQADNLTYSSRNLPIDLKRKLRDNVNMTDHIREQNIVAESRIGWADESDVVADHHKTLESNQQHLRENLESLRLAQHEQEEAECVREIQRLQMTPVPQDHQVAENVKSQSNEGHGVKRESEDKELRRSRLQRTCQNQNFDISDNLYPEQTSYERLNEQGRASCGLTSSTRASSQQKSHHHHQHNNLFCESPDFILTTGKFLEEERRQSKSTGEVNNNTGVASKGQLEKGNLETNFHDDSDNAITDPTRKGSHQSQRKSWPKEEQLDNCKVFSLDRDFLYVGTRSGHKYFVERISSANK